jgi:peptidoglycan hydrolase-like protein with peptidoglycan-binding domain/3D (Asp-Asp-Asp) domain-containing protein
MSITFRLPSFLRRYNMSIIFFFMRRITSLLALLALSVQLIPITAHAEGWYYLVSAYYSPLEWQDFYLHGSFAKEVKMNGEGKTTASWQPVRIGAIAAPREIPYNTRVHIKQNITIRWTAYDFDFHGTILDRGGAIHSAAKLPRLDIYMGKWQEWLCRAINFGVQTVYASFDNNTSIPDTSSFDSMPGNCSNPNNETVPLASGIKKAFDPFTMPIGSGSPTEDIQTVQKLLTRVNTYTGPINGLYNETLTDAIFHFQKTNNIVKEKTDDGAGVYGPKTRAMLKALLSGELNKSTNTTVVNTPVTAPSKNTNTTTEPTTNLTPEQKTNELGDVRELQTQLKDLWFFKYDIDGIYNKRLVDALYAFQLAKKIVTGEEDPGAGYFGPVTKSTLSESYASYTARKAEIANLELSLSEEQARLNLLRDKKKLEFMNMLKKIPTVKVWKVHPEIRTLQKKLKELGYMNNKDTAIFGAVTKAALAKYQLDLKVIDSLSSPYAGVLGDKTREAIAIDLYNRWLAADIGSTIEVDRIKGEIEALKKV